MSEMLGDLTALYRDAFRETLGSMRRAWIGVLAIYLYALALQLIGGVAGALPIPLLAGLLIGLADALAVGALLALVQHAITGRSLGLADVRDAFGAYFLDVVSVGFILWIPFMLLAGMAPPLVLACVSLLAAVFLNPLPEVIYQVRTASPLESLAESARFVQQQWIEWFVPIVLVAAPLGSFLFFSSADVGGLMRGGLSFGRFLLLPTLLMLRAAEVLGLPPSMGALGVAVGAPLLTFGLLLFRGHLFAALAGTSRRQRAFRRRVERT
jgi:hypothetical protein